MREIRSATRFCHHVAGLLAGTVKELVMQNPIQFVRRSTLVIAGVVLAAVLVSARSAAVVFQGLTHTAVGSAVLRFDKESEALAVATFDPAGGDGVLVSLPETTSWTSRLQVSADPSLALKLSFDAVADSRRISTASMTRTGDTLDLSAVFTGAIRPTYTAAVYQGGQLVGALGSLPPTAHVIISPHPCDTPEFRPFFNCDLYLAAKFRNTANGECVWELAFDRPAAVRLPNGTVLTGNEVRLVEEVSGPGSYPYQSFDGMVVRTNVDLTLHSETVR